MDKSRGGGGWADGRKKREHLTKDEPSVPTVSTEALLLICLIDTIEKHHVATVDITGLFMQAEMEGDMSHMKM